VSDKISVVSLKVAKEIGALPTVMPAKAGRIQKAFDFPGFRVALAIASLPGMTIELFNELKKQHTSVSGANHATIHRGSAMNSGKEHSLEDCRY
jgi:hypothetical protein